MLYELHDSDAFRGRMFVVQSTGAIRPDHELQGNTIHRVRIKVRAVGWSAGPKKAERPFHTQAKASVLRCACCVAH